MNHYLYLNKFIINKISKSIFLEKFFNINNKALIFYIYFNKCTINLKITFRRFENFINIKSKK